MSVAELKVRPPAIEGERVVEDIVPQQRVCGVEEPLDSAARGAGEGKLRPHHLERERGGGGEVQLV